jgi:hypothetical protein
MAKKITFIALVFLFLGSLSYGLDTTYTAKLSSRIASPNDTVHIKFTVTGFTNISSFQFYIHLDPSVLTYQMFMNFPMPNNQPIINLVGDNLSIVWTGTNPLTISNNAVLMTLVFRYNGLSSPVAFIPGQCEVARFIGGNFQILSGSFTDGSVTPKMNNIAQAKLDTILNAALGTIADTLRFAGFPANVGSITQRVSYDPTKLTFIGVTGIGNLSSGYNVSISSGIISIAWSNASGKNINYPGSYFKINFSYINSSPTNVGFSTGCVIETTLPVSNIPVTYLHGFIAPPPMITSYASLGNVIGAIQGQILEVPLLFDSMPVNTSNFNINITFDSPRLAFLNINSATVPVIVNQNGNLISITNANPLPPGALSNGQFLVLQFVYQGVGIANLNFANGCQFSNGSPIGVGYANGTVAPAIVPGNNANIGFVTHLGNGSVNIPITFTNMPTNLGAVTMLIGFDAAKLTYTGLINPFGATIKQNSNIIKVAWSSNNATNLNNTPFVTLQFNYIAGSGANCSAPVYFTDYGSEFCEITDVTGQIVPSNWYDGGVNVKFKISGTLKYDNPPLNSPLEGFTVKLKLGSTDVATTTVTSTGYFEMWAGNGLYYLEAVPTASANYYSDENDASWINYYAAGYPGYEMNALRLHAGDINQDGITDENDASMINYRIAGYPKLPYWVEWTLDDWVFGGLSLPLLESVNVNCNDVANINYYGICAGNVTGSNIP